MNASAHPSGRGLVVYVIHERRVTVALLDIALADSRLVALFGQRG
jgi:histone H3/H4